MDEKPETAVAYDMTEIRACPVCGIQFTAKCFDDLRTSCPACTPKPLPENEAQCSSK